MDYSFYGFFFFCVDPCEAASKMLQGVTPPLPAASSQPSTSGNAEAGPPSLEIDEELMMRSKNLSSTLQKLYLWEKKLYQEVKVRSALFFAIITRESSFWIKLIEAANFID
jgi:hypothetical protein